MTDFKIDPVFADSVREMGEGIRTSFGQIKVVFETYGQTLSVSMKALRDVWLELNKIPMAQSRWEKKQTMAMRQWARRRGRKK